MYEVIVSSLLRDMVVYVVIRYCLINYSPESGSKFSKHIQRHNMCNELWSEFRTISHHIRCYRTRFIRIAVFVKISTKLRVSPGDFEKFQFFEISSKLTVTFRVC